MVHRSVLISLATAAVTLGLGSVAADAGSVTVVAGTLIPAAAPPALQPGARVAQAAIGTRSFANRRDGFALAELSGAGVGGGATYPVKTVDGGRTWRIAGPYLHRNAADAPDVVTASGVGGGRLFFAYGGPGGGQAVDVTTDAGRRWWRAYLPAPAEAVAVSRVSGRAVLVAFLQGSPAAVFVSRDGGHHWRLTRSAAF